MAESKIEWTDKTWNPVRGCQIVSAGCKNCYAMKFAHRFSGEGKPYAGLTQLSKNGPVWTGTARFVPEVLDAPLHWRKPQRIFVNSMSDLFHDDVTNEQIAAVFAIMGASPQHTFQILTKRPERMREWFKWVEAEADGQEYGLLHVSVGAYAHVIDPGERDLDDAPSRFDDAMEGLMGVEWPLKNVWLGVSCEDQAAADKRIPLLLQTPAAIRFVSAEPLLGPINFEAIQIPGEREGLRFSALQRHNEDRYGQSDTVLDWIIPGGESGNGHRGCYVYWIRSIVAQCLAAGTAVFVKQLGHDPVDRLSNADGWDTEAIEKNWPTAKAFSQSLPDQPHLHKVWLHDRKGGDMREWPADLRVRQFPEVA